MNVLVDPGIYDGVEWTVAFTFLDEYGETIDVSDLTLRLDLYASAGTVPIFTWLSTNDENTVDAGYIDMSDAHNGTVVFIATAAQHADVVKGVKRFWHLRDVTVADNPSFSARGTAYLGLAGGNGSEWRVLGVKGDVAQIIVGARIRNELKEPKTVPYAAYNPSITHSIVFDGESISSYNHVPFPAIWKARMWIAWQGNPNSPSEAQTGQIIYMSDTALGSSFPGTRYAPFDDGQYTTNPITPNVTQAAGPMAVYKDNLYCFWMQRNPTNEMLVARKTSVDGKWTNFRMLQNTTTGELVLSSSVSGTPPTGYSFLYRMQGEDWQFFPCDAKILKDGRFCLVILLISQTDGVGGRTRSFTMTTRDFDTWTAHGIIEDGALDDTAAIGGRSQWEPTLFEPAWGGYLMAVRTKDSNLVRGKRTAYAVSSDLESWSPYYLTDMDLHNTRPMAVKLTENHWGFIDTTHGENRNAMGVFFSGFGDIGAPGIRISNEVDSAGGSGDFVHYSHMIYEADSEKLYTFYSQGPITGSPQNIKMSVLHQRIDPEVAYLSPCSKNSVRDDVDDEDSYFETTADGLELVVPPQAVAGAELRIRGTITLKWRVSAVPNTVPYVIASLSNFDKRFRITLNDDSGTPKVFANGVYVYTPEDCTEWQTLMLFYDRSQGLVGGGGAWGHVGTNMNLYLGNDFDSFTGTDNAGEIRYLVSGCSLTEWPNWPFMAAAQWLYQELRAGRVGVEVKGGGSASFLVQGEGAVSSQVRRFSADGSGPIFNGIKGRGTLDARAVLQNSDVLVSLVGTGTTAISAEGLPTFTDGGYFRLVAFEATPSPTAMGTQFRIGVAAPGGTAITILLSGDHTVGLQMLGATFLDIDRGVQKRSRTVAQLASLTPTAGREFYCSDESGGAVPVFGDGTNWRRVTDRAIVS